MNIDREFGLGKMAESGLLDRFLERNRPCGHAIEKLRSRFGRKRNKRTVSFSFRLIIDDCVLIRRNPSLFGPKRSARRAVADFHIAGPVSTRIEKIEAAGEGHASHFDRKFAWQNARDAFDGFEI